MSRVFPYRFESGISHQIKISNRIDALKLICIMDKDEHSFSGSVHGLNGFCLFAGNRDECPIDVAKESADAHIEMLIEMNMKIFVDINIDEVHNDQHVFTIIVRN